MPETETLGSFAIILVVRYRAVSALWRGYENHHRALFPFADVINISIFIWKWNGYQKLGDMLGKYRLLQQLIPIGRARSIAANGNR